MSEENAISYLGRDIRTLEKDELITALTLAVKEIERMRDENRREREMMQLFRKARC